MKINPIILVLAVVSSLGITVQDNRAATVIDFTAAEGYTDGYLWTQTPSSGHTWSTISDFTVNTSGGGSVTTSPAAGSNSFPARYSQAFSSAAGQTLSLSMDFTFLGVNVTTPPATAGDRQVLATLNFGPTSNMPFDGVMGGNLTTLEFAPAGYSFQVFSNEFANFTPESVGLTSAGGTTSDQLRLSLTSTVASSGSSSYTMELYNVDTSTLVFTVTGSADLTSYSALYAAFSGGGSPTAATSFTATSLTIDSIPEPGTYALLLTGPFMMLALRRRRDGLRRAGRHLAAC